MVDSGDGEMESHEEPAAPEAKPSSVDHRVVVGEAVLAVGVTTSVGVRVGYIPGWETSETDAERAALVVNYQSRATAQWWTLLRARSIIAEMYAGHPLGNLWAAHAVELGCLASQWLQEHLAKDGHETAWNLNKTNSMVADAHCLANTHKHAGRDDDRRVGRVLEYNDGPDGTSIRLAFARPNRDAVTYRDALELLDGCVAAWDRYMQSEGLERPPLPNA